MRTLFLFGMGRHADVVAEAANGSYEIIIRTDDDHPAASRPDGRDCFVAAGDITYRERIAGYPLRFVNVIHPLAHVLEPLLGKGIFVACGATVARGALVGDFAIINTHASLDHHSQIGAFSHLAPGVVTGGRVHIGHHTTVGIGAMIRDGVRIGNHCTIGMGSVVTKDVPDNTTGWGNPFTAQ